MRRLSSVVSPNSWECRWASVMRNLGLYYRTVRHIRATQLLWRARYAWERSRAKKHALDRWRWAANRLPRVRQDFPTVPILHRTAHCGEDALASLARGEFF